MLQVTKNITIDENEIRENFIRASGPGGQNVNKVATAVQLRFDVRQSSSLPDDVRKSLFRVAGHRMTENGVLIIEARRYRRQGKNRQDARDRLVDLVRKAAKNPKPRRTKKPSLEAKKRRLKEKRKRSEIKQMRKSVFINEH